MQKPLGFHRLDVEANPVSKADAWVIGSCADKADILVGYSDNDAVEDRPEEIHCALDFYPKHNSLYVRAIPGAQVICKDIDDIGKKTRTAGAVTGLTISGQSWTLKFEQNYSQQKLENQMDAMRARRKQDSIKQPLVAVPTPSVDAIDYKRWTLDKVINHGGNGAIYSGRNVDTGQPMAATMMIIHANSRDVVRREILALRTLQSDHIVRIVRDYDPELALLDRFIRGSKEFTIIVEPLVDGNLYLFIGRPMGGEDVCKVCLHMFTALEAMHKAGFVHRDMKSGNFEL